MSLALKVGVVVEVLTAEEILATLDENGELDNLPFMPEMLRFCGRRLTVHKVANKLCDTMTRTGNISSVSSVGHCSRNPAMIVKNPMYCGCRTFA